MATHYMPAASKLSRPWQTICDFDGTITPFDVTDAILREFAAPEWELVEDEWESGHITARECMERQIGMIRTPLEGLDAFLDTIPVTEGFTEFVRFCAAKKLPLMVVSDGMDYAIRRVLSRHGLHELPVIANRLVYRGDGTFRLSFPFGVEGCPSGVCKCTVSGAGESSILLIGDGRSDCCLAGKASLVLAREDKELLKVCGTRHYPHHAYSNFFDVRDIMENLILSASILPEQAAPLHDQAGSRAQS